MRDHPQHARRPDVLLVGTANPHKVEEIRSILAGLGAADGSPIEVVGAERLPPGEPVEETGEDFVENAALKAADYALRASALPAGLRPRWVIADDSGLCVDALGGAPGVRSARYAGPDATADDNNRKLLSALAGTPPDRRGAEFVCVIACAELPAAGEPIAGSPPMPRILFTAEGRCRGEIIAGERGTAGFGYDPLFLVPELGLTFAQLPAEEKNRRSHRGRALRVLRERLGRIAGHGEDRG